MWEWLTKAWKYVGDSAVGQAIETGYDTVSDFAKDTYDDYFTDYSKDSMSNYFTTDRGSSTSSALGTALDFTEGFLKIAAAPSPPGSTPKANMRRISGKSGVRVGQYSAGKSNLKNMGGPEMGYTPRVQNAIMQVNTSNNPSIKAIIEQMKSYNGGSPTIKLGGSVSVAARAKKPSFAPKYYG